MVKPTAQHKQKNVDIADKTMYYYEDMSVAEIAMTLSMNINTVKTRLARGRAKLRDFLD